MGPSGLLRIPDHIVIVVIGMTICSFIAPIAFIMPINDAITEV